jgi:hypothetical protein
VGDSPFLDFYTQELTGGDALIPYNGPLLEPVVVTFSIDLTTGAGYVTDTAADQSFVWTTTGLSGAFSLENSEVVADDPALLFISQLESPVGVPVPRSDAIWGTQVQSIDVAADSSTSSGASQWSQYVSGTTVIYNHITNGPEPTTLILSGTGIVVLCLGSYLRGRLQKRSS